MTTLGEPAMNPRRIVAKSLYYYDLRTLAKHDLVLFDKLAERYQARYLLQADDILQNLADMDEGEFMNMMDHMRELRSVMSA